MKLPGAWRLSQMGLPVPPTPTGDERLAEIYAARERLTEEEQADPVWDPENNVTWNTFFSNRRLRQLNDYPGPAADAPKRNNSDGRKRWWGMPYYSVRCLILA